MPKRVQIFIGIAAACTVACFTAKTYVPGEWAWFVAHFWELWAIVLTLLVVGVGVWAIQRQVDLETLWQVARVWPNPFDPEPGRGVVETTAQTIQTEIDCLNAEAEELERQARGKRSQAKEKRIRRSRLLAAARRCIPRRARTLTPTS